jgi:hypothetical protein
MIMPPKRYYIALYLVLMLSAPFCLLAKQETESDKSKERLTILLKERTAKFDKYSVSITQRSGIFGNQTKKDLRQVNEILMDITQTDNVIFKELKRLLDYKDFEKGSAIQSFGAYDVEKARYVAAIDTLNKQLEVLKAAKKNLQQQNSITGFFTFVLGIITLILLYFYNKYRKRNNQTSSSMS